VTPAPMTTLRDWFAEDDLAEVLLDAQIVHVRVTDGRLALVLELSPDDQDDNDG